MAYVRLIINNNKRVGGGYGSGCGGGSGGGC